MSDDKPARIERHANYPEIIDHGFRGSSDAVIEESNELHLLDYWRIIVVRRWTIVAVLVTSVALTTIWSLKQTPIYRATASIQIDESDNILTFKDVVNTQSLQTQIEVLQSRAMAQSVVEDLNLVNSPEFAPEPLSFIGSYKKMLRDFFIKPQTSSEESSGPQDVSNAVRAVVGAYQSRLTVSPVKDSRLVSISFEAKDPKLASLIINAHADEFIEQNLRYKYDATQRASSFLASGIGNVKAGLEKSEEALQRFGSENQILYTDEGKNTAMEKLGSIQAELTKAQVDRIVKQAYDPFAAEGNLDALPQIRSNPVIEGLTAEIRSLQRQDAELAIDLGPDNPRRQALKTTVEQMNRALNEEKGRVLENIKAERSASVERERLLQDEYASQLEVVETINQASVQYGILKREVDSSKQLFDSMTLRLREAEIAAPLPTNIRILDLAEVPGSPVRPEKTRNVMVSIVFGLVVGVGMVFFREYLDDTFKSPEDITRYLQIPALGVIPQFGSRVGRGSYLYSNKPEPAKSLPSQSGIELTAHHNPSSVIAEAYRSVRTSLMLSSPDHPPRTILITSAAPSEGKTSTAANLAVSLTQMGSRVVIIDADMRKPRLHNVFGMTSDVGLSNFLTGGASLRNIVCESSVPNLFVITCGVTPPNPGELIVSNRFKQLIDVLGQYFDYIVIDSPPLNSVSDARVLATICDGTVVVARASSTSRRQVRHAVEYLLEAHARIAGVVLNDLDARKRGYYGYAGDNYYRG